MRNIIILVLTLTILKLDAQNLEQTFRAGKANKIKALVHITGGKLIISGGSEELAHVKLDYNKDYWDPNFSYTEKDDLGKLVIKASTEGEEKKIEDSNVCYLQLNSKFKYQLGVVLGAGVANLNFEEFNIEKALFKLGVGSFDINLANTSLQFLKIDAGIGEVKVDLSGAYKNNLKAEINAGIGGLNLYVPEELGIKLTVNGFLGNVDAKGFSKKGHKYTNSKFGKTKYNININVDGAIGSIKVYSK